MLPANRKEDELFRNWIATHEPEWTTAQQRPSRYPNAPDDVWHTSEAPWPIDTLNAKLASPRNRIKTRAPKTIRQEKRGRPGKETRYRKITRVTYTIDVYLNTDLIAREAASDGCWPRITNDCTLTGAEILAMNGGLKG